MVNKTAIDLFCGTKSFGKIAEYYGYDVQTMDFNHDFNPDICQDILTLNSSKLYLKPDIVWASPPCTTFSVASLGHHWTGGKCEYIPKTEECKIGLKILEKTVSLISQIKPTIWFIENPRGVMRKVINEFFKKYNLKAKRYTITYCQYGDIRMKPTDIWSNINLDLKPMCHNGDSCHVSAPRGSRTGTQGLKGAIERSMIPELLIKDILDNCEEYKN